MTLTTEESIILCADKFGDVYALPLFENKSTQLPTGENIASGESLQNVPKQDQYIPSANSSTVHTKRNQQALKNQQNLSNKKAEKKELGFELQLLLGHVSLLTDLAYVTFTAENSTNQRSRSYIITSDRDEHIRISRGLPQAYVIEGYCLGHTEFISKLCVFPWNSEILVSGGGDDYLIVWDWVNGNELQKIDLRTTVEDFRESCFHRPGGDVVSTKPEERKANSTCRVSKIAVSGICAIRTTEHSEESVIGQLIVTCEGKVYTPSCY